MIIGEIGINHNGSIELAKRMIDMAIKAGVDVVKFQKRNPDVSTPEHQKNVIRDTPWGEMKYIDYKHKIEFWEKEYDEIDAYCVEKGIRWTASVWDKDSVDFIGKYKVPFIKVPSAKITDLDLLNYLCTTIRKPIIISTGMSTEDEIDVAIQLIESYNVPLTIMHCNSTYPAKDNELNLSYITHLKSKYPQHIIGYSGHEEGISASIIAAVLGAKVIERHITLSRSMWGTDQAASLVYDQLYRLVRDIKKIPLWLGDGQKRVYSGEKIIRKKLQ